MGLEIAAAELDLGIVLQVEAQSQRSGGELTDDGSNGSTGHTHGG